MEQPKPNIDPAISEAWEEGRLSGIREAADRLERMEHVKEWEGIRGIWRTVRPDGWSNLRDDEKKLLKGAANVIRRLSE